MSKTKDFYIEQVEEIEKYLALLATAIEKAITAGAPGTQRPEEVKALQAGILDAFRAAPLSDYLFDESRQNVLDSLLETIEAE